MPSGTKDLVIVFTVVLTFVAYSQVTAMSDAYIIKKVEDYFYFEDDLCETIERWAQKHCDTFPSAQSEGIEQPLEHMQLFNEYTQLFESLVESFLQTEGISLCDFYGAVRNEYETAQLVRKESSTFTSILLASLEFSTFCEMIHSVKKGNGVIFCPPLVDDDEVEQVKTVKDAASCHSFAMPKSEYKSDGNEDFYKGSDSDSQAKASACSKPHK